MIKVKLNIKGLNTESLVKQFMPGGQGIDTVMRITASSMLGIVKTRIHEEGKAADGAIIGQYNKTTPLYVNPKNSPKGFKPEGKTGKSTFETGSKKGQPHATKYFQSYFDYKTFIGRNQLGTVNLSLSGQLDAQFVLIETGNGNYGLGWLNTEMYYRAIALEKKYGKPIWALTDQEQKQAVEIANYETNKIINA